MRNPIEYGLTEEEYLLINKELNREPNHVEMGIFSAMWSEHCSYKHTKSLLKQLPTQSEYVVQGPGENAGVVSIDKDWNVVFKIESHNHPSYLAPYDGAATGVGGLLRDVMVMGARPIGVKPLLRFGSSDAPEISNMIKKVRQGATDYASECGVASLGEELFVHPSFIANPLVNVIVLGLAKNNALMQSNAGSPGNQFVCFGRPTGSDGVDGASFASKSIDDNTEAKPPSGDPVVGKELMEATLTLIEKGLLEGLQDMGAAGLTSSSFEMTFKSECGFEMNLGILPKTSDGLSAYELMLSETQERMLASVKKENVEAVLEILASYPGLSYAVIGQVIPQKHAVIYHNNQIAAQLPIDFVVDGFIRYQIESLPAFKPAPSQDDELTPMVDNNACVSISTSLNGETLKASKLNSMKETLDFGPCSAVIMQQSRRAILLRTLSNGSDIVQDPYQSIYQMISRAYGDLKALGAKPIALSDCLNSGNPDDPQTAFQIIEGIRGLSDACHDLSVPVIGGNVSLYNETNNNSIISQFIIGMIGYLDL